MVRPIGNVVANCLSPMSKSTITAVTVLPGDWLMECLHVAIDRYEL